MKKTALELVLAGGVLALASYVVASDFSSGWEVLPVAAPDKSCEKDCLPVPADGVWQKAAFKGVTPQHPSAKKGDLRVGEYNSWYRKSLVAPDEWKGRSVRLEFGLNCVDAVVFVNGQRVGVAFRPDGAAEISPFLAYGGATNEVRVFVTNRGHGTGEETLRYLGRDGAGTQFGQLGFNIWGTRRDAVRLEVRSAVWTDEVWVEPSWREKRLSVFARVHALAAGVAEFAAAVREDGAEATVVEGRTAVTLQPGENTVRLDIPWADPKTWEPVANPALYTLEPSLSAAGAACAAPGRFLFGFRELWRDGKDVFMNGHPVHWRGFYLQGLPNDLRDVHRYGFNLAYATHQHEAVYAENQGEAERYSRAGLCKFTGLPSIYSLHGWTRLTKDETCLRQWKRHLAFWMRSARNWPSVVAASCGVNQMNPTDNMEPERLGQAFSGSFNGILEDINLACKTAREMHPNCLYFSHADGTAQESDISSSNLYFNFTPLQERESWLQSWAKKGIRPWYPAEFGAPYYACWFHSRIPEPTEWLAAYYGERAYAEETPELLANLRAFAKDCRRLTHGGWVDGKDLYAFSPLMEEYSRMLVYRTNRAWRGYGQNLGMMYLTGWKWDSADRVCDRHRLANGDLVTWLGGAPEITDRTHAYWAGEKIAKNLVFCWDGVTPVTATAAWRLVDASGAAVSSGSVSAELKPGDILWSPIELTAPEVASFGAYRLEVAFDAPGIDDTVKSDVFPLEVYAPQLMGELSLGERSVGFVDPEGGTKKWMAQFGVRGRDFASVAEALADTNLTHLVVGRRALEKTSGLERAAAGVRVGLSVWVGPQLADTWKVMGFDVEDQFPRQMYNVGLGGVPDSALAHWRGLPKWENAAYSVMHHGSRRGPRWRHDHALGGVSLIIPDKAGFRPLVRGEFDLSYTLLAESHYGAGAVLYCAFDFEDRIGTGAGGCPAASAVARAALKRFLGARTAAPERTLCVKGAAAERLAKALGADAKPFGDRPLENGDRPLENAVLLVGGDVAVSADELRAALGEGSVAYVFGGAPSNAAPAGAEREVSRIADRAGMASVPALEGVGGSLTRWREPIKVRPFRAAEGWTVVGDGLFAVSADGRLVLDAVNPFQACDRYRKDAAQKALKGDWAGVLGTVPHTEEDMFLRSAAQSEVNDLRRLAIVLDNLGVRAGAKTFARSLYLNPFPKGTASSLEHLNQINCLGPWPIGDLKPEEALDTVFKTEEGFMGASGADAEKMAAAGDFNPNPRFFPAGGLKFRDGLPDDQKFLDWRPAWWPGADGTVEISWMSTPAHYVRPCAWYAVGAFGRSRDGTAVFSFSAPNQGKLWVNGQEVCRSANGAETLSDSVPVKAGRNTIGVKLVSLNGSPLGFTLRFTKELKNAGAKREMVKELDGVELYETAYPMLDPYEYIYW